MIDKTTRQPAAREWENGRLQANGRFHPPFQLRVAPMARLLLINIQNGTFYKGIEPQWFDDAQHGRGLLVILYRVDGKVDVYHEPAVTPDAEGFNIEAGLGEMLACRFERARFEIGAQGVDADIAFTDRAGRRVEVLMRESGGKRAGRFALLAPLGHTIKEPQEMPLFFMYDFSFVKIRGTALRVAIDGVEQKLYRLPVPMGGSRVYFSRYCADPLIAFWNPARAREALPAAAVLPPGEAVVDGVRFEVARVDGRFALAAMHGGRAGNEGYPAREVRVALTPPLPEVTALRDGERVDGRFTITSAPEAGVVRGSWRAQRNGRRVTLRLHPDGGWQPGEKALMPRLIFTLVRPFKRWPTSYEWTAEIDVSDPSAPVITSGWRRIASQAGREP